MASRFVLDHKGIASLKREAQMHAFIGAVGAIVSDSAKAQAPRRKGFYEGSIEARMMGFADARCRVYARDFKANWIEDGAGPSPMRGGRPFRARHPLRNAAIATGLRFSDRSAGRD